jgi:hypothetical protein
VYGIYPLHPMQNNVATLLKMINVEIESICSDMSETMSQVSIDPESKLSPSDIKLLLAELKGSK